MDDFADGSVMSQSWPVDEPLHLRHVPDPNLFHGAFRHDTSSVFLPDTPVGEELISGRSDRVAADVSNTRDGQPGSIQGIIARHSCADCSVIQQKAVQIAIRTGAQASAVRCAGSL